MTTQSTITSTTDLEDRTALALKRMPCEIITRVMGYHRPVSQFNLGKKSEHYERVHFQEKATLNSQCAM